MSRSLFMFAFAFAQGAAVFLTALLLYRLLNVRSWLAKIGCMILSFVGWITFTLFVFFWGANSYIVFFGLTVSAFWSSAAFLALWLLVPLMRSRKYG